MTSKEEHLTGQLAVVGLFIVAPVAIALIVASAKLGPASIPIWMAVAGCVWLVSKGAIGEAFATRLRGDGAGAELSADALAELDELRGRVLELEERVDFSERMLAQKEALPRLERPGA